MPDLGWSEYIERQELAAYLEALTVTRTEDEHGNPRYFVTDGLTGDWIGEAFSTADAAFDEVDNIRKEHS